MTAAAHPTPNLALTSVPTGALADDIEGKDPTSTQIEPVDDAPISSSGDKRVQRKIDRVVMTLTAAVYFMQYLDKRGLSFAGRSHYFDTSITQLTLRKAIFGMRTELGLQGQDYS